MQYILCGRVVCQSLWLGALAISTSRFYDIRKEFVTVGSSYQEKKAQSLLPKSMKCVEWMRSYFDRVGDKRPKMGSTCPRVSLKKQSITS